MGNLKHTYHLNVIQVTETGRTVQFGASARVEATSIDGNRLRSALSLLPYTARILQFILSSEFVMIGIGYYPRRPSRRGAMRASRYVLHTSAGAAACVQYSLA